MKTRPNPTDAACRRCGEAVAIRTAIQTSGYCEHCALAAHAQPTENRAEAWRGRMA